MSHHCSVLLRLKARWDQEHQQLSHTWFMESPHSNVLLQDSDIFFIRLFCMSDL